MLNKSKSDLFSYVFLSIAYVAFIYFFSDFVLREFPFRQCSLSIVGNDWYYYLNTADVISNLDITSAVSVVLERMGSVDFGYWFSTYFLASVFGSESFSSILYASVVALSFALARPLLSASRLLIFVFFATFTYSFAQNIVLLPRQFCSYFLFEIAVYCFLVSDKQLFHPRIVLIIILSITFHWTAAFLCLILAVPILVKSFLKLRYKLKLFSAASLALAPAGFGLYLLIRSNVAYKIGIYSAAASGHDVSRGLLSFFVPFLSIALIRIFIIPNLQKKYEKKSLLVKNVANWMLFASFSIYVFFVVSQSLGITRLTLFLYAILIPLTSYVYVESSRSWRELILSSYLLLFAVVDINRILKFINYISC